MSTLHPLCGSPTPPDDNGRGALLLTVVLIGAGVVAALSLLAGRTQHANDAAAVRAVERAEDERAVRAWADRLGRPVAWASCPIPGRCTVAFEEGPPAHVACSPQGCAVAECQ